MTETETETDTTQTKVKNGVFPGRFQPFHKGHLSAVMMCLERCETLYVGIRIFELAANFDVRQLKRSAEENPFTFEERMRMIKESLLDVGVDMKRVNTVPFPLENPERWHEFVPKGTAHFRIGVSDWDEERIRAFEMSGLKIITLPIHEKDIDADEIRRRMIENRNWKELLPGGTVRVIEEIDGTSRVKMLVMNKSWRNAMV